MSSILYLGSAFALSLVFIPVIRRMGFHFGVVAIPRQDRWHRKPTPILGGLAIFLAFAGALLIGVSLTNQWGEVHWGLLIAAFMMFGLGIYDDFTRLSPPAKLVGQIIAATVVIFFGYTTNFFTPRLNNPIIAQLPNILLTFIWLVGITNAVNLLDNMDGLAGGIALITATILSYLFWLGNDLGLLMISLALMGGIAGFLLFNFPPASIFMGDGGSLFLGFILAVLAIARQPQASNVFAILGVPTLLFMLPILDTTLVTFTRLLRGQSPAQGGRDHTSHRLIAFGLSERQAVLVLYAVAIVGGSAGLLVERVDYWLSLLLVPVLVLVLALLTAYLGRLKVVAASTLPQRRGLTRVMNELAYRRRVLEIVLDFLLIGVAYYLALLIHYQFAVSDAVLELFLQSLPIALGSAYAAFSVFGVYRGVWRYIGVDDLLNYAKSTLGAVIILAASVGVLYSGTGYAFEIFIFFGVFLFLGLAGTRSSFKILDQAYGQQARQTVERVLIYGAGDEGEMAVRWILMNPELGFRAVGYLDGDPYKVGRYIHGVEILGTPDRLDDLLTSKAVNGVVITKESKNEPEKLAAVLKTCKQRDVWVRSLRLEFEQID